MRWTVLEGDNRAVLATLPDQSVHCAVTSPPYWNLRDYGVAGQLGQEDTPEDYVSSMVAVFSALRRVLRNDGTLWLNLGDSYANASVSGLKAKDLVGIPWRVAFALQADGWYLRSDIIWHKPNPIPESVTDRPSKAHEYIFLLSKEDRYYYDADAIREKFLSPRRAEPDDELSGGTYEADSGRNDGGRKTRGGFVSEHDARNKRSVWTQPSQPYHGAHFATFPTKLIQPCILAGCPVGGTVLDPFSGAGTTGVVACRSGRDYVGIELNPTYAEMSRARIRDDSPMFNVESSAPALVQSLQRRLF